MIVAAHPSGQWELIVRASGTDLHRRTIKGGTTDPWTRISVDLSPLAGKTVFLELLDNPTANPHSEAYWGQVEIVSR
jgi:hypothetical protein